MGLKNRGIRKVAKRAKKILAQLRKENTFSLSSLNDSSRAKLLDESFHSLCRSRNDPRARLELVRLLPSHMMYFITSSRRKHDPLMILPQIFQFPHSEEICKTNVPHEQFQHLSSADYEDIRKSQEQRESLKDNAELAVPMFTELRYLRVFARLNHFSIFGPDGDDWISEPTYTTLNSLPLSEKELPKDYPPGNTPPKLGREIYHKAFPVYPFECPLKSSFVGCFGEFSKIIEHLAILPPAFSLVLNPSTMVQWKMPISIAQTIGRNEGISFNIYNQIAHKVSTELFRFFAQHCPEVVESYYWIHPQSVRARDEYHSHNFAIAIGVISENFSLTMDKLKQGRMTGDWLGHPSVVIQAACELPRSWLKVATVFYVKDSCQSDRKNGSFNSFSFTKQWDPCVS